MYARYIFNNKPVISGLIVPGFHKSSAATLGHAEIVRIFWQFLDYSEYFNYLEYFNYSECSKYFNYLEYFNYSEYSEYFNYSECSEYFNYSEY